MTQKKLFCPQYLFYQQELLEAEYAGLSIIRELGLGDFLSSLGFSKDQIDLAILLYQGLYIHPASIALNTGRKI